MVKLNLPKNHLGVYYTRSGFELIIWVIVPPSSRYLHLNDGSSYKVKLPKMAMGYEIGLQNFGFYSFIEKNKVLFNGPPNAEGGEICWGDVTSKINFQNLEFEFWNSASDCPLNEIDCDIKNGVIHFIGHDDEAHALNLISKTGDQIQISNKKISAALQIRFQDKVYFIRVKKK